VYAERERSRADKHQYTFVDCPADGGAEDFAGETEGCAVKVASEPALAPDGEDGAKEAVVAVFGADLDFGLFKELVSGRV